MELTAKQKEGLKIAVERYRHKDPYTVIAGYAGVGKTTLVRFIISALNLNPEEDVAYVTFTGKASQVLRDMGNPNAMTAHKLLYHSKQMPNGKFKYTPRKSLDGCYKIIVVDEISMLPIDLWNLLLSHHIYVIACGDPFQIPPINPEQNNHVLDHPHIFLDEVMRQAKESDIICTSMDIRSGKQLVPYKGNDIQILPKNELVDGMYFWADQILCATNNKRYMINDFMRKSENRSQEPEIGDKIICSRNSWNEVSINREIPLINGTIGYFTKLTPKIYTYNIKGEKFRAPVLIANFSTTFDDEYQNILVDYTALTTGKKFFSNEQEYWIRKNETNLPAPIEFNYGHAITCHKAQGSQWEKVLTLEEWFPNNKIEHARWVYTAITRASQKATLVLKK